MRKTVTKGESLGSSAALARKIIPPIELEVKKNPVSTEPSDGAADGGLLEAPRDIGPSGSASEAVGLVLNSGKFHRRGKEARITRGRGAGVAA